MIHKILLLGDKMLLTKIFALLMANFLTMSKVAQDFSVNRLIPHFHIACHCTKEVEQALKHPEAKFRLPIQSPQLSDLKPKDSKVFESPHCVLTCAEGGWVDWAAFGRKKQPTSRIADFAVTFYF